MPRFLRMYGGLKLKLKAVHVCYHLLLWVGLHSAHDNFCLVFEVDISVCCWEISWMAELACLTAMGCGSKRTGRVKYSVDTAKHILVEF
ncbi:hypothetical protein C8R46DRAFT_468629 [Mycena filopes]|nr:hypothetical protein C8R46DRAFT_468629 [Mycena filopes]